MHGVDGHFDLLSERGNVDYAGGRTRFPAVLRGYVVSQQTIVAVALTLAVVPVILMVVLLLQKRGIIPTVDAQGPNPRSPRRRLHASLVSKRSSFPTLGVLNRSNRLPSALGAVQSPRILPRSGAIDGRDQNKSRGGSDLGMRMHDDDTPSPSFDSLRPGVTFRANNSRPPSFPLDCWHRCGT